MEDIMQAKERIFELDVIRGLAFLAVVYQHIIGGYTQRHDISIEDAFMLGMVFNLVKFAVPAFVFVTGVTLFYNYYEKLNYVTFMRKRVVDIFIPFVIWTIIYYLYIHREHLNWDLLYLLKSVGRELIIPASGYHLWYIVMIFQFYLLFPLLLILFKWCAARISYLKIITGAALIYGILMWLSSDYLMRQHESFPYLLEKLVKYRSLNGLMYFFYFLMGAIAALSLYKWRDVLSKLLPLNIMLFIIAYIWVGYELVAGSPARINLNYATSLKPSMFVFTVLHMLLLYSYSVKTAAVKSYISKFLSYIGHYSYGAFLVHVLAIHLIFRAMNHLEIRPDLNYLIMSFIMFVVVSLVSVGVTVLISYIPYAKLLIGSFPAAGSKRGRQNKNMEKGLGA
jgi:peptidoglycan/LPS O-acetylase OafA/YrhL